MSESFWQMESSFLQGKHTRFFRGCLKSQNNCARGQKSYGERSGKRRTRTSLIAGKRGKQLLAPFLFEGSTNALWFNQWLQKHLLPQLNPNSTLSLDNTPFHRKDDVFRMPNRQVTRFCFCHPIHPILILSNKTLRL
ncbi:transposase [Pleurocapsales cyanobacterium LEGE 10410]|nr:transposase [Pleurocapsales cyanobacterium LEGE 10410]